MKVQNVSSADDAPTQPKLTSIVESVSKQNSQNGAGTFVERLAQLNKEIASLPKESGSKGSRVDIYASFAYAMPTLYAAAYMFLR